MEKQKRTRRVNPQTRIAAIDKKIAELQAEKERLQEPLKVQALLSQAADTMSAEEIASKLGIELPEV